MGAEVSCCQADGAVFPEWYNAARGAALPSQGCNFSARQPSVAQKHAAISEALRRHN
eukprot:SAG11_NODE_18160_length_498_cov_1.220551_1_plen_56_part_01